MPSVLNMTIMSAHVILLLMVNLSLEMDSATSVSYNMTWEFLPSDAIFCLFWQFLTARAQFRRYYNFPFKI